MLSFVVILEVVYLIAARLVGDPVHRLLLDRDPRHGEELAS